MLILNNVLSFLLELDTELNAVLGIILWYFRMFGHYNTSVLDWNVLLLLQ
jgi:hypothetical protein